MPERPRLSHAERRFLEAISTRARLLHPERLDAYAIASETIPDQLSGGKTRFSHLAGMGEVNEVRGVFQRIFSSRHGGSKRLDEVEILHTDYGQYVPLILEQVTAWLADTEESDSSAPEIDMIPVTFAEGVACIYSRPGRALRAWLRWARHDFVQTRAVQLIREGLLFRPADADRVGFSRLADALRKVPIGFQRDRYLPKIRQAIESAEQSARQYHQQGDSDDVAGVDVRSGRDFGLSTLRSVWAIVQPLVDLAPTASDDAAAVLTKARQFLVQCARADNKLDRAARDRLLDDIDTMMATLNLGSDHEVDLFQWLEQLPIESRIMARGPQPGAVHVSPLSQGGHSGREQIFVVGLDDSRYPKRVAVDPVLLDSERKGLSRNLQTSADVDEDQQRALDRSLYRALSKPAAEVCLSYSVRNLAEDRANYPSASMLELFRLTEQKKDAHMDDLIAHVGPPVAFVSKQPEDQLCIADRQLAKLLGEPNHGERQRWLEEQFEHARLGRIALESKNSKPFGEYDGFVPVAGTNLDPSVAERVSPSRLETYGACPRRYFFRYGLGLYPPDEWIMDRERWLDPLQYGNLVHGLFEQFLCDLTARDLVPSMDRDRGPLLEMLAARIEALKSDNPIPNEDAFRRTCDVLEETCEIFLTKEEQYCRDHHARPWVLEASIGLPGEPTTDLDCEDPIPLTLSDGRVIRVGGRLDRVDQLTVRGSQRYAIWDYKSGSSFGFDQERPFNQGRKLQPFLYAGMLRHRLAAMGRGEDAVESFGYFFPGPRTQGLRLQWTRAELRGGDGVLKSICDLICHGVFAPTTDPKDCVYCDYLTVCGDADAVAENSRWKASQECNHVLAPLRELREIEISTEERS